jgi:hypothetical protein
MSDPQTALATRSVETPSGRISYVEAGAGPVALFVHGVLLNKHLWRRQLAGLSDIRRCIAVDLLVSRIALFDGVTTALFDALPGSASRRFRPYDDPVKSRPGRRNPLHSGLCRRSMPPAPPTPARC